MESVLRCDCGFEARADNEQGLVARVQEHALEVHGMEFSSEDVLRLAIRTGPRPHTREPDDHES